MTTATVSRAAAIRDIADALADRTSFVVTVPPGMVTGIAAALVDVPLWTVLLDNGLDTVLRLVDTHDFTAAVTVGAALGLPLAGVVLVPKTVPAELLGGAIGQAVPADGSRDLLVIGDPATGPIAWPRLFVDALARVDPAGAAQLRALASNTAN